MFTIDSAKRDRGLHRLLNGPRDVRDSGAVDDDVDFQHAAPEYRDLFEQYSGALVPECARAAAEWDAALSQSMQADAETMWFQSPAGPATKPSLVALLRDYWLACAGLPARNPSLRPLAPEVFMLKWVVERFGADHECVQVLACMPYWPIGMDEQGHWV
ncbi:MAG TPA: hypothetical protein VF169_28285 [Albitalea sp.]|uniref:hypothetical protein n=1 Tax=Piscinibacter sp. TaxID=1903157 RepID=UPI002ED35E4A